MSKHNKYGSSQSVSKVMKLFLEVPDGKSKRAFWERLDPGLVVESELWLMYGFLQKATWLCLCSILLFRVLIRLTVCSLFPSVVFEHGQILSSWFILSVTLISGERNKTSLDTTYRKLFNTGLLQHPHVAASIPTGRNGKPKIWI